DKQKSYVVNPDAVVTLNGAAAAVGDLAPNDVVTVEMDSHKRISRIDAARRHLGIIFSAGNGKIELTTDFTDKDDFDLAPDAKIVLNGRSAQLEELKGGEERRGL